MSFKIIHNVNLRQQIIFQLQHAHGIQCARRENKQAKKGAWEESKKRVFATTIQIRYMLVVVLH